MIKSQMSNTLRLWVFCIGVFSFGTSGYSFAQDLTATLDRNEISLDETVTLTVQYSGNSNSKRPNFDKLNKDFEILSTQSGNQIFGDMSNLTALTQWTMVLSPKKEGVLKIPVFSIGISKSAPLTVNVTPVQAAPAGEVKDVFIETVIEKDSAYVQEQLILKYRLFYSLNIDSLEREPIEIPDVINEQLPDVRYNRKIKDKVYGIAEFNYALYPQTSGEFEIPALVWDVKVPKNRRTRSTFFDFNGRFEIKRLRTESKVIKVLPEADNFPNGKTWLPAKSLTLEEKWSKAPSEFVVGEPITRTLTLKADGLMASQLPQIWGSKSEGEIKVYADQADLKEDKSASGGTSQRVESAAVVVSSAGDIQLPALRVPWWNVSTNTLEYAELPARTLSVRAPAGSKAISTNSSSNAFSPQNAAGLGAANPQALVAAEREIWLWRVVSAVLAAALLALLALRYFTATATRPSASQATIKRGGSAALSALASACKTHSAVEIRKSLILWASTEWPHSSVSTLDEISNRINDERLSQELSQLDRSLFSPENTSQVNGTAIFARIKSYLEHKTKSEASAELEEFYVS